jgi:hypothetical protein
MRWLLVLPLLLLPFAAFAQTLGLPVDPTGGDPMVLIQLLAERILAGDYRGFAFVGVMGATWLLRTGAAKWVPHVFGPDAPWHEPAGVGLSLVTAFVITFVYGWQTGTAPSWNLALAAVGLSWTASGGFSQAKKALLPVIKWLATKLGLKAPAP